MVNPRTLMQEPFFRKYAYLNKLASKQGVDLTMYRWESILDEIYRAIGYNVSYRCLLDMYLDLSLAFFTEGFEWWPIKFEEEFTTPLSEVTKARYGMSQYGMSVYDPEQIFAEDLERMLWDTRYKASYEDVPAYKNIGKPLVERFNYLIETLKKKNVKKEFIDALEATLALVEGKTLNASYVGFATVGNSRVMGHSSEVTFELRIPKDWKRTMRFKTVYVYESHVGMARVGYARVVHKLMALINPLKKEFAEKVKKAIDDFKKHVGVIYQYGVPTIYQRVFWYQKIDQMHYRGGEHQLRLQRIINEVKKILNRRGVASNIRLAYLSFAQELYYLHYQPQRIWKRWKRILTIDDLIDKYIRMGCDKGILEEIKKVIKP